LTHPGPSKLAVLLPDLRGGGVERIRLVLAREFERRGYPVELVLLRARGELLAEAREEFAVHSLDVDRARGVPAALIRYLRAHRPRALLAAMWPYTAIAPVAAKASGHPGRVVVSEHSVLSRQYAGWGRLHGPTLRASVALGYRLADAVIGVSRGVVDDLAQLSGLAPERFEVIHNPVRPSAPPSPQQLAEAEALWGSRGPRILNVGTLKPVKNHGLLLRAFAGLSDPEARLMLVGHGQDEAALRKLAAELGIAERVIFAGFRTDPAPLYATASVFALSSDHEGFGNVLVEALGFGLRVVSTDCPWGPSEILERGRWGRMVPVKDAEALSRALAEALVAPLDREALRRRAAQFSPAIAADRYLRALGLS
jgi:glycosyltransferase involved in cell wall biosynthesis